MFITFIMLGRKYLLEIKDALAAGACAPQQGGGDCKSCVVDGLENPTMGVEQVKKDPPYKPFALFGPLPRPLPPLPAEKPEPESDEPDNTPNFVPPPPPAPKDEPPFCGISKVTITNRQDAASTLRMAFSASLGGEINKPTDITYNWRYQGSDKQNIEPPNNTQRDVTITFPSGGIYYVFCDVTYKNGGLTCTPTPSFGTLYVNIKGPAAATPAAATPAPSRPPSPGRGSTVVDDVPTPPSREDALLKYRREKEAAAAAAEAAKREAAERARAARKKANMNREGKLAGVLAARRAKEEAEADAPVRPSPAPSRAPSRSTSPGRTRAPPTPTFPILETFTKTVHAILNQIKSGSTILTGLIKDDIKRYSSQAQEGWPMMKLSRKYTINGKVALKLANELKDPYIEGGMSDDDIKERYKEFFDSIWSSIKAFKPTDLEWSKKFLRNMIIDIFTAYVNQYDIEGAPDVPSKITKVLVQMNSYIGSIHLDNPKKPGTPQNQTVFDMLGITDEMLSEAATTGEMQR
jgi:hypothetical protein